jgi:hypothetical protein
MAEKVVAEKLKSSDVPKKLKIKSVAVFWVSEW